MTNRYEQTHRQCKHRRPSSFAMQAPHLVFDELGLREGDVFLDIGCGAGDYALRAASMVGDSGQIYALDRSGDLIDELEKRAVTEGHSNVTARVADATELLPIRDNSIDVCLVATVLHIPEITTCADHLLSEIGRVLRPHGCVAIIECSKKDLSYGPPEEMRLSADQVKGMLAQHNFKKVRYVDLGFNYMVKASRS